MINVCMCVCLCAARLSVESQISVESTEPLQFTVTCESVGGNPANVVWMRDSTVIQGGHTELNEDYRSYSHSLTTTEEGFYTCTVSNDLPDNASASINATSESTILILNR